MVRQFDAIATSETWIVLDLNPSSHAGEGENHSFERAVEIAASIATCLIRTGLRCGLAGGLRANGTHQMLMPPAAGSAHLQALMNALAEVQADCSAEYAAVLAAMSVWRQRGQQWILFDHDGHRAHDSAFLRVTPAPLYFRFDTASFAASDHSQMQQQEAPRRLPDGYSISRNSDLALLFA